MTKIITPQKAREVDAMCRARDGLYYGYGEAFTNNPRQSTDCSGLVLQTGAWWMGRTDWPGNRYGSTESFRLDYKIVYDLGFRRGKNPPINSVMRVGLQHGGGGVYSHTACTLMTMDVPGGPIKQSARGVDWESQGAGVFYYEGARAWNDPLFHDFWYLDAVLGSDAPSTPPPNEIDEEAKRAKAWIGARKTQGEVKLPDGEGRMAEFENGYVYWSPRVNQNEPTGMRAIAIPRDIFEVWAKQGWEKGPAGYPTRRHATVNGVGTIQAFQRAVLYRKIGTPGAVVNGAILERWAKEGWENGRLGWPLGSEQFFDGGRVQQFEKGEAYFHPSMVTEFLNDPEAPKQ
jgi:hypothetical protein